MRKYKGMIDFSSVVLPEFNAELILNGKYANKTGLFRTTTPKKPVFSIAKLYLEEERRFFL